MGEEVSLVLGGSGALNFTLVHLRGCSGFCVPEAPAVAEDVGVQVSLESVLV